MANIPVTNIVPPFNEKDLRLWAQKVSGFCQGAQSVKVNEALLSTRIGAKIFLEGEYTKESGDTTVDLLPVAPRIDGYMTVFDTSGTPIELFYTKGSKSIDISSLSVGKFYINSNYFAQIKG